MAANALQTATPAAMAARARARAAAASLVVRGVCFIAGALLGWLVLGVSYMFSFAAFGSVVSILTPSHAVPKWSTQSIKQSNKSE